MKVARYLFEQLFNRGIDYLKFHQYIFNPQMIELLFDENKTNIPLQIHSQKANLHIYKYYDNNCPLKFALNHLTSNQFTTCFADVVDIERCLNVLFKILTNGGNKFSRVCYKHRRLSELYNLIIKVINHSEINYPLII